MSARALYAYGEPVNDAGVIVEADVAAGVAIETHFGKAWKVRIAGNLLTWSSAAFVGDSIGGRSIPTFGAVTLANDDGELDPWTALYWDGRPFYVFEGNPDDDLAFTGLLTLVADQPTWTTTALTVPFKDGAFDFERPVQPHLYAGTGTYEGGPELVGTPKPLLFGNGFNIEPVLIDAVKRVYQIHDGPIVAANLRVKEGGLLFGISAVHLVSDVYAWTEIGGHVAVDAARGVIRFGATPVKPITVDALDDDQGIYDGLRWTHANLAHQIATRDPVIADNLTIDDAALTALNAAVPNALCGMYVKERTSHGALIDRIATSCGALWSVEPLSRRFTMRQIGWTPSVGLITETMLAAPPERIATDIPAWRVKHTYRANGRPLSETEFDAAADANERASYTDPNRGIFNEDTAVQTLRRNARDLVGTEGEKNQQEIPTIFFNLGDASIEAARQFDLLKRNRDRYSVKVWGALGRYRLGDTVTFQHSRFGLGSGKDFIVLGLDQSVTLDTDTDMTTLVLWGPKAVDE